MEYDFSNDISKFIKDFDCKVVEVTQMYGHEVKDNVLYLRGFKHSCEDEQICELLKRNPKVDTLYIGRNVTDRDNLKKIHYVLLSSHNVIPIIKNIILEDDSRFYSVDGLLIDRITKTVLDYASGRDNETIVVPDGIVGLKEYCFNYNEYVKQLFLPSSIKDIPGITSLPSLENVVISISDISTFTSDRGVIHDTTDDIYFIPPYNPSFPHIEDINTVFDNLLSLVKTEAGKDRWPGVIPGCFSRDSFVEDSISIIYNGGFYSQRWNVRFQDLPTKIVFGYFFYAEWDTECACRMIVNEDYDSTIPIKLNCENCSYGHNCDNIFKSNKSYISNLVRKLKDANVGEFKVIDKGNIELQLSLNTPMNSIIKTLLGFLDVALDYRKRCPIIERPMQSSIFNEMEMGDGKDTNLSDGFPFNYSPSTLSKGFMVKSEIEYNEEEPPF